WTASICRWVRAWERSRVRSFGLGIWVISTSSCWPAPLPASRWDWKLRGSSIAKAESAPLSITWRAETPDGRRVSEPVISTHHHGALHHDAVVQAIWQAPVRLPDSTGYPLSPRLACG